jgi:hypothetical protein
VIFWDFNFNLRIWSRSWDFSLVFIRFEFVEHQFIEIVSDTVVSRSRDTDRWFSNTSLEVRSEIKTDEFRNNVLGFGVSSVFFVTRPDIGVGFFVREGVSGVEEEPVGSVMFFEVNVQHNSVILDIILDSESIGIDEDMMVINLTD